MFLLLQMCSLDQQLGGLQVHIRIADYVQAIVLFRTGMKQTMPAIGIGWMQMNP